MAGSPAPEMQFWESSLASIMAKENHAGFTSVCRGKSERVLVELMLTVKITWALSGANSESACYFFVHA